MTLSAFAAKLNEAIQVSGLEISKFQHYRRIAKNLKRGTSSLFNDQMGKDDYVIHYGGRSELQFNIGTHVQEGVSFFRWGLAFSLERSRKFSTIGYCPIHLIRYNFP